jgi:hypothetical protein
LHQANASSLNLGNVDTEPALALPAAGLVGNFRFGRSLALSLHNRAPGGGWGDLYVPSGAPTIETKSARMASALGYVAFRAQVPVAPMTILSVYEQPAEPANLLLGGYDSGGAAQLFLRTSTTGANGSLVAFARKDPAVLASASTPYGSAGPLWDMAVARFDVTANQVSVTRPRTNAKATAPFADWTAVAGTYRIGASAAESRHVLHLIYSRVLSDGEIAGIYASAKASLATSGINI